MTTTDRDQSLTTRRAVRTVARRVLAEAVNGAIERGSSAVSWEDHPEIGEYDWDAVLADVRALAERTDVQTEHYESARRHLAGRVVKAGPALKPASAAN